MDVPVQYFQSIITLPGWAESTAGSLDLVRESTSTSRLMIHVITQICVISYISVYCRHANRC